MSRSNGNGVRGHTDLDMGPSRHGTGTAADPYDALADLFLGGPAPVMERPQRGEWSGDNRIQRERAPAEIECLVMGHLPVLGSPWASQYTRCLAESLGAPVGYVQVRDGHATVEVVGAAPGLEASAGSGLAGAISAAAGVVSRWVVRVDEAGEAGAASNPAVGTLTLLTAGDQASVVGSYVAVKRVLESSGCEHKSVRISIMAAAPEAADAAYGRLAEAVRSFTGRPVQRAPGAARIGASGPSTVLYSGPTGVDLEELLGMLANAEAAAPVPMGEPARPAPASAPSSSPPGAAAAAQTAPSEEPDLAGLLGGLSALEVRCPYAPEVQLAADASGGLHLLTRHEPRGTEALATAEAWARAHAGLLAAAGVSGAAAPVRHLLVGDARDARRLLETDLRVHLLAPVEAAGGTVWFCRPLN